MERFGFANTQRKMAIWDAAVPGATDLINGYPLEKGSILVDETYFSVKVFSGTAFPVGLINGGGSSASPLTTSVADKNFMSYWTQSTATSGDSRGLYWRHYLGGTIAATGYGDGIRAFTTVTGTGYSYASGLHATMQINADATVTGSGSGLRATLAAAEDTRTLVGALSAAHICSDIATGNTLPTVHGFLRFTDDGAVRISNLAVIPVPANGTIFAAHVTQGMTHSIRIIAENGTPYYIMCASAATNRS